MSTRPKGIAPLREDQGAHTDIVYMCLPLIAMAVFFYGPRPALLCAAAVVTANLCDRLVALLRGQKYEKGEWSSEAFALLLTLMMPATASYYMVIVGTLAAVLVGKEAFGGYGAYLFHPAAVGYAVVAVSWSGRMFAYPDTSLFAFLPLGSVSGVNLVESPSHMLREGGLPTIDTVDLVLGNYAGPMGTTVLLVILACALFLIHRRRMGLVAPLCFIFACAFITLLPHDGGMLIVTGLAGCSPLQVLQYMYYPLALIIATLITIQFGLLRTPEEKEFAKAHPDLA